MLRAAVLCLGLGLLLPSGSAVVPVRGTQAAVEHDVDWFRYVDSAAEAPAKQRTRRVARCPAGTQATGGGVRTTGESAKDAVVTSAPFDSRDRDRRPDDGWVGVVVSGGSDQLMVTSAVCGPFEVSYVTGTRRVPAQTRRRLDLSCPDQLFPTGGGARSTGTSRRIMLGESAAGRSFYGWRVRLDNLTRRPQRLTGYAVCMREPGDFSHTSTLTDGQASPGINEYSTTVCDVNSEHVAGGGLQVVGVPAGHVIATSPVDDDDADFAPDDGWTAKVYNETGGDITIRMTSSCLP